MAANIATIYYNLITAIMQTRQDVMVSDVGRSGKPGFAIAMMFFQLAVMIAFKGAGGTSLRVQVSLSRNGPAPSSRGTYGCNN